MLEHVDNAPSEIESRVELPPTARPGHLSVWAPRAQRVEVQLDDRTVQMVCSGDSWWTLDDPEIQAGTRYGFRLDGGAPLADPRSLSQPDGPDGLSEIVDHQGFKWNDSEWDGIDQRDAVIYELHVGTFTDGGTLDSAIDKLDHLKDLGINVVELMPLAEFPGNRGWGYDGVDLFAVEHTYGGPSALRRFVDAAHERGIGVVLDVVYNHFGPAGDVLPFFGPYHAPERTIWGPRPNFDGHQSLEIRRFVQDNVVSWIRDFHIDGLRVDSIHSLRDSSPLHMLEVIAETEDQLEAGLGRKLMCIAESQFNTPRVVQPRSAGGLNFDAQWVDDFHKALHVVCTGDRREYYREYGGLTKVGVALERIFVFNGCMPDWRNTTHFGSIDSTTPDRYVTYMQQHDHIGNRGGGERFVHIAGIEKAKIAAALSLLAPTTPMLFQGEEWGSTSPFLYFIDHSDPELVERVRSGRRTEFRELIGDGPMADPQDPNTMELSKLRWNELHAPAHAEMYAWHQRLLALRREFNRRGRPEHIGATRVSVHESDGWICVDRAGVAAIIANFNNRPIWVPMPDTLCGRPLEVVASSKPDSRLDGQYVVVAPMSAVVVATKDNPEESD